MLGVEDVGIVDVGIVDVGCGSFAVGLVVFFAGFTCAAHWLTIVNYCQL